MLARQIAGAAEVTLRAPPPLETDLGLVEVGTGVWELRQGTTTIAIGRAVTFDLSRLERASYAEAMRRPTAFRRAASPTTRPRSLCCTLDARRLSRRRRWLGCSAVRVVRAGLSDRLRIPARSRNREFQRFADPTWAPFRTHRRATASGRALRGDVLENRQRRPASHRRGGAVW